VAGVAPVRPRRIRFPPRGSTTRNLLAAALVALLGPGCVGTPNPTVPGPVLTPSRGTSAWPVEGENRPGLWIRFSVYAAPRSERDLLQGLRLIIQHGNRAEVITGEAFRPVRGGGALHQTAYLYTPPDGVLFLTLQLEIAGRRLFPDTERIELNDDCWHMLDYRVRGAAEAGQPPPPPYPRTVFLTPALSSDPPLYLEVFLSGNCFRNPLPPF
jgi:hypothetical protein